VNPPVRRFLLTAAALMVPLGCLTVPGSALAVIEPATVIEGPANDILDVDGSAMAPDGSGGIVYRKQVGGVAHVFVAQFLDGHWTGTMQADTGNQFNASQPAIAAGTGGRLLVVWVQPRNVNSKEVTEYELVGASLQPGASAFGQPVVIDPDVGEPYTGDVSAVTPDLAMAPDGTAYVVYRVVTDACGAGDESNPEEAICRPNSTDEVVQVRVARFNFLRWSSLGAVNRAPQIAMLDPTASNAPSIGIDLNGDGIVAWQEPGADGVARIWVRRLFGTVVGNVLEASPEQLNGQAVTSDADAPMVAMSPYGAAEIAFRIQGAPGSAVPTTELYGDSIADEFDLHASQLGAPVALAGTPQSGLGPPSAAMDLTGELRVAWSRGGEVQQLRGAERKIGSPVAIGSDTASEVDTTINPAGGGVTAWRGSSGGAPVIDVREDEPDGNSQAAQLAGNVAGEVTGFSLGGSGQGDALLGWMQGTVGQSEVVGDFVQAPPAPFDLDAPVGWVDASNENVTWQASPDAEGGVTYSVYVDGKPRMNGLTGLSARLGSLGLGDGAHQVLVIAHDAAGEQTASTERTLKVDANPPIVSIALVDDRRGVRVTVRDRASGVDVGATRISFGDGGHVNKRAGATHVYRHAGTYVITAQVSDNVGNSAIDHLRVEVR
jgi:hypothetical protein